MLGTCQIGSAHQGKKPRNRLTAIDGLAELAAIDKGAAGDETGLLEKVADAEQLGLGVCDQPHLIPFLVPPPFGFCTLKILLANVTIALEEGRQLSNGGLGCGTPRHRCMFE